MKSHSIAEVAQILRRDFQKTCRLAPFVLMTDPERLPDVVTAVAKLPPNSAVIYRHFGKSSRKDEALAIRDITQRKNIQLLIGNDPELALACQADGVHFSRDAKVERPMLWRQKCPNWIISMAGLKQGRYEGDIFVLDALFVSSIFQSSSPSAGTPIGIEGLKAQTKNLSVPIFALGGINTQTAPELLGSGAAGLAAVTGLEVSKR